MWQRDIRRHWMHACKRCRRSRGHQHHHHHARDEGGGSARCAAAVSLPTSSSFSCSYICCHVPPQSPSSSFHSSYKQFHYREDKLAPSCVVSRRKCITLSLSLPCLLRRQESSRRASKWGRQRREAAGERQRQLMDAKKGQEIEDVPRRSVYV